ncbi:hypothetical protein M8C21_003767 [Ambrosia artemisiifolia]|uniref:Uncharacterized protein n=1 Tax=Ambrosia artemisiifolia TaxID=4212 RepID=A0AAD5D784_AMBAR|nr:hypothetical protein M8C21_003767 [Ambrosia artemisiifolia]
MGCGMSKSHLLDEGFGSRNPFQFHHKTNNTSPELLINDSSDSSDPSLVDHPPMLQKIHTSPVHHGNDNLNPNSDAMWIGSPSFRVYIQSSPTIGHEQGKQTVIGTHGGANFTCNDEVRVWGVSNGEALGDTNDVRGGRFRKAFQVHRVAFWHSGPWHVGHAKASRNVIGA